MGKIWRIGRLAGVPFGIQPLWLLVVGLISWSLGDAFFPDRDPGLDPWAAYLLGFVSALLLFAGVLLHELGHAVVARRRGVEVEEIDLWLLGGVARMTGEPKKPQDEFAFAIAGPAVTLAIGLVCGALRVALDAVAARWVLALLDYQLIVSAMILGFNMLPAFPLDGGRVLRALLWRRSGDRVAATARAAAIGYGFGVGFLVLGGLSFFSGAIGGLWLAIVGFFLMVASRAEAQVTGQHSIFADQRVADLMSVYPKVVDEQLTVAEAITGVVIPHLHAGYPVVDATGRATGLVTLRAIRNLPWADRERRTVAELADGDPALLVDPATPIEQVMAMLSFRRVGRVVAVDAGGRPVGILSTSDLLREQTIHTLLGDGGPPLAISGR